MSYAILGWKELKYLVQRSGIDDATKEEVKDAVGACVECCTIDPTLTRGEWGFVGGHKLVEVNGGHPWLTVGPHDLQFGEDSW